MVKIIKTNWVVIVVYLLFIIEIIFIYNNLGVCSFEHDVKLLDNATLTSTAGEYIYEVENNFVNEADVYKLVTISGYLVGKENDDYFPVNAKLLLLSDDKKYEIYLHQVQRSDIVYVDQSNRNSKDLFAGWLCKFPANSVEAGEYKIGFIIHENGNSLLMTDRTITI